MSQLKRDGVISFGDASITIRTEGYPHRSGWAEQKAWESQFKREVFGRLTQQLNRMGWTCKLPTFNQREKDLYPSIYEDSRRSERECCRGEIKANLKLSFGTVEFQMWQDVQNGENSNGGRYDFDKEKRMTFQQRLRMEYTRRKLREYLCNVFTGYEFKESRKTQVGPGGVTAMEWMQTRIRETGHYREDLGHASIGMKCNETARDGGTIKHGATVWFRDWRTNRIFKGQAFYDLNQSWFVVSGKYGHAVVQTYDMYTAPPPNLRQRMTSDRRRKRLESLMQHAVKAMDFERAAKLRDILLPKDEALFMIYSDRHELYFRQDYSGYTRDTAEAGKYTRAELKPYLGNADEKGHLRAVPVRAAA